MRNTNRMMLAAAMAALAVASALPAAAQLPPDHAPLLDHADAGCTEDASACGAIVSTMDGCTTAGHVVATGASADETTEWRFRYVGYGYYGRVVVEDNATGNHAAFKAWYSAGLGIGYTYSVALWADGELIASTSNSIRC